MKIDLFNLQLVWQK